MQTQNQLRFIGASLWIALGLGACSADLESWEPAHASTRRSEGALTVRYVSLTADGADNDVLATYLERDGEGMLYVFDFTRRKVLRLDDETASFADALASLGAAVDRSVIRAQNPELANEIERSTAASRALREVREGEFVPAFEVARDESHAELETTRSALSVSSVECPDAELAPSDDDTVSGAVLVVVNEDEMKQSVAPKGGKPGSASAALGGDEDETYCTVAGLCVYCDAYNNCVSGPGGCYDQRDWNEDVCDAAFEAAEHALEAAKARCYQLCDDGYRDLRYCRRILLTYCKTACDLLAHEAHIRALLAYSICMVGVGAAFGGCKEGCLLGSLAPGMCD